MIWVVYALIKILILGQIGFCSGDFTMDGQLQEIEDFSNWLGENSSKFKHIVLVAGNHDITLEKEYYDEHGGA